MLRNKEHTSTITEMPDEAHLIFVSCAYPLPLSGRPRRTLLMVATALHSTRGRKRIILTTHTLTEAPRASFKNLLVSKQVHKAVADQGWESPTPIQTLALPALLRGEDVVGLAQTGSGKTAAFSIPLIEAIDPKVRGVQALVLVPTRELAAQAATELTHLSRYEPVRPVVLCGGVSIGPQIKALRRGRRRHAGAHPRPPAKGYVAARLGALPRARRGRSDARHGLCAGRRAHPFVHARQQADRPLFGHDARGDTRHGQTPHALSTVAKGGI